MKRIYLDACSIIYTVEATSTLHKVAVQSILKHRTAGPVVAITSRLSWLECRVKPLRIGNQLLLEKYKKLFSGREFKIIDIDSFIIDRATHMRAHYGLNTPDAIHMATALEIHADVFITGDINFSRCSKDIELELLSDNDSTTK